MNKLLIGVSVLALLAGGPVALAADDPPGAAVRDCEAEAKAAKEAAKAAGTPADTAAKDAEKAAKECKDAVKAAKDKDAAPAP